MNVGGFDGGGGLRGAAGPAASGLLGSWAPVGEDGTKTTLAGEQNGTSRLYRPDGLALTTTASTTIVVVLVVVVSRRQQ